MVSSPLRRGRCDFPPARITEATLRTQAEAFKVAPGGRSRGLLHSHTPVAHLQQSVQQHQNHNSSQRQHQHGDPDVQVPARLPCRSRGAAGLGRRRRRMQRNLQTMFRADDGPSLVRPVRVPRDLLRVWEHGLGRDLQGGSTGDPKAKLHCCCLVFQCSDEDQCRGSYLPISENEEQDSSRRQVNWSAMLEGQYDGMFKKAFVLLCVNDMEKINIYNQDMQTKGCKV